MFSANGCIVPAKIVFFSETAKFPHGQMPRRPDSLLLPGPEAGKRYLQTASLPLRRGYGLSPECLRRERDTNRLIHK